jgi:hypothetical protein
MEFGTYHLPILFKKKICVESPRKEARDFTGIRAHHVRWNQAQAQF